MIAVILIWKVIHLKLKEGKSIYIVYVVIKLIDKFVMIENEIVNTQRNLEFAKSCY